MASTIPGIRLVRCPNCRKILTEFAEVPVYKCGGCGIVLRGNFIILFDQSRLYWIVCLFKNQF